MTTLFRLILWLCCAGVVAVLWHRDPPAAALAAAALGVAVYAWQRGGRSRRRRTRALRYVEVAKQPLGLR